MCSLLVYDAQTFMHWSSEKLTDPKNNGGYMFRIPYQLRNLTLENYYSFSRDVSILYINLLLISAAHRAVSYMTSDFARRSLYRLYSIKSAK